MEVGNHNCGHALKVGNVKVGNVKIGNTEIGRMEWCLRPPFHPANLRFSNLDVPNLSISNVNFLNTDIVIVHVQCHSYLQPPVRQAVALSTCTTDHMADEHGIIERLYFPCVG